MVSIQDKDKRKKKLRAENQEAWRDRLDFKGALISITRAENAVEKIACGEGEGDIGAYRLLLDSKWRRINKLLGDKRDLDLTSDGERINLSFSMKLHEK